MSQIFYSSKVYAEKIIKTMRVNDPIEVCANKLKSECKTFDFGLNNSFRNASDVEIGMDKLRSGYKDMKSWNKFFDQFFPTCKSKLLIQLFNRLGLCTSYDDVERIDMAQTKQLIDLAGSNRVPETYGNRPSRTLQGDSKVC